MRNNFKLALIVDNFKFYVNQKEDDINNCVKMYDLDEKLISNNYFAYQEFMDNLEKIYNKDLEYTYISIETKKGMYSLASNEFFD